MTEIKFPCKVKIESGTVEEKTVSSQEELDELSAWSGNMNLAFINSHGRLGRKIDVTLV